MQWTSPAGTPMQIAATAPEFPWSDLAQALMPNGSSLDYVADSPYRGATATTASASRRTTGTARLFLAGAGARLLRAGRRSTIRTANLISWNTFNSTGGPYDGSAAATSR